MLPVNTVLALFDKAVMTFGGHRKLACIHTPARYFDALGFRKETHSCLHGEVLMKRSTEFKQFTPVYERHPCIQQARASVILSRPAWLMSFPAYALSRWFVEQFERVFLQLDELRERSWRMLRHATMMHPPLKFMPAWWLAESLQARWANVKRVLKACRSRWLRRGFRAKPAALPVTKPAAKRSPAVVAEASEPYAPAADDPWFSKAAIQRDIFNPARRFTGMRRSFIAEQMHYCGDSQKAGAW